MFEDGDRILLKEGKLGTIIRCSGYSKEFFLVQMDNYMEPYGSKFWTNKNNLELFVEKQTIYENLDKENWWEN